MNNIDISIAKETFIEEIQQNIGVVVTPESVSYSESDRHLNWKGDDISVTLYLPYLWCDSQAVWRVWLKHVAIRQGETLGTVMAEIRQLQSEYTAHKQFFIKELSAAGFDDIGEIGYTILTQTLSVRPLSGDVDCISHTHGRGWCVNVGRGYATDLKVAMKTAHEEHERR